MQKIIPRIISIIILEVLFRWMITGNGNLILLVSLNILILGIIFYDQVKILSKKVGEFIINLRWYKPEIMKKFIDILYYIFKQYLFVISIVVLVVSIFDRLFMNYFYLPLWLCFLFFTVSSLVILPDITAKKISFADREIKKIDIIRWIVVLFFVSMLITFRFLPLYQTYFYALFSTFIIGSLWFILFAKKSIVSIFRDIFLQIIGWLTVIAFIIFLWNSFPQIKQNFIITEKIYIDRPIYINKNIQMER